MSPEDLGTGSRLHVPQADGVVSRSGRQGPPIGRERHGPDPPQARLGNGRFHDPRLHVPQLDPSGRGGQCLPIGGEGDDFGSYVDDRHLMAGLHVPQPDPVLVTPAGGEDGPIGRVGHVHGGTGGQQGQLPASGCIVQPDAGVRPYRENLAIGREREAPDPTLSQTEGGRMGKAPGMEVTIHAGRSQPSDRRGAEGEALEPGGGNLHDVRALEGAEGEHGLDPAPVVRRPALQREPPADPPVSLGDREGDLHTRQGGVVLIPHLDDQRIRQHLAARSLLAVPRDHHQPPRPGHPPFGNVPEPDPAVLRSRGQRRSIGRERHRVDSPALPLQGGEPALRGRVPQADGQVRPGSEQGPVGGEGHRSDGTVVPFEHGDALRQVPQPHGGVSPCGCDQGPIR